MTKRIMTLFGEEVVPEQVKGPGKSRASKSTADEKTEVPKPEHTEEKKPAARSAKKTAIAAIEPAPPKPGKIAKSTVEEKHIVLPEDWQGDKNYYTIGEVAELFKVRTSNIRFWTNEFKIKVRTTRKGDRLFTPEQIKELRAIHHLVKERGFTLAGAKAKLKTQNNRDVETVDLKQSLQQLRGKLVIIRNQLT